MMREAALARLAKAEWLRAVQPFFACLEGAEGRTRAVGGIVRDTLLGRSRDTTDIDLATELTPEDVMARGEAAGLGVHPTGLAHGTVTLVHQGQAVEVTTLRHDVETFGRHARVAFGAGWTEDARRRDFTMNALYCGPDGVLFDPLGGLEDCLAGRVRFIGDPDARIAEDRLRVYRYFRFAASHGGQRFDEEAVAACRRAAGDLAALSAERVGSEMMRLLGQRECVATLEAMVAVGMLPMDLFSPQVLAALNQLETLSVSADAEMRLAVVALGGSAAQTLRAAWRLSNAAMKRVSALTAAGELAQAENWRELTYRYPDLKREGAAVAAAAYGHDHAWLAKALAAVGEYAAPAFPLSGGDLVSAGMEPGRAVGAELERLEKVWIESDFTVGREALLALARLN